VTSPTIHRHQTVGRKDSRRRMDTVRTEREVLTVPEVAELLRLGPTKTWELVKCGSIPSFRPGARRVLVRRAALEHWIGQCEEETKKGHQ
jgi:excisionase family DNA binding protein